MKPIIIPVTKFTPRVQYNAETNVLELVGESYPENAMEFYRPIQEWLRQHLDGNIALFFLELKLTYFNTSSSKCILDLLSLMEERFEAHADVAVRWYTHPDDEDMRESGQEFAEGLAVPFEFLSVPIPEK